MNPYRLDASGQACGAQVASQVASKVNNRRRGDTQALVDGVLGYRWLRVSGFRVSCRRALERSIAVRKFVFVERRSVVYELCRKIVLDDIR